MEDTNPPLLECKDIFKVLDYNNNLIDNPNLKIKVPYNKLEDYQEWWGKYIDKNSIIPNE